MPKVEVTAVQSRRDRKHWLELPWKTNAADPLWVPPLRMNQKLLAGFGKHAFYDQAEGQAFLAKVDGKPAGRVLAIVNEAHNDWHKEKRGFFGFFESINDQDVANSLFTEAEDWLRSKGMTAVRGPANPSINYEWGLLIDGFDKPPFFMMTHNPSYYQGLIEEAGFEKAQDLFAYWGDVSMIEGFQNVERMVTMDQNVRERFGVTVRQMDKSRFRQEVETFLHIYNEALTGTWGYVPLSKSETHQMAGELKHLIVPELAIVAEIEDRPIGVTFGLLDYNPRIREIDGRLFPFGFIKLLSNKKKIDRIRLVSTNVLPEYQSWGVGLVLALAMFQPALDFGLSACEMSWVLESNNLSRKTLEKGGADRYKTYRVYDKNLG